MYKDIEENIKSVKLMLVGNILVGNIEEQSVVLNSLEELIKYLNNSIYNGWKFTNLTYSNYSNTFYGYINLFVNNIKMDYYYLNIHVNSLDMDMNMIETVKYDFGKIVVYKTNMINRDKNIDYFIN